MWALMDRYQDNMSCILKDSRAKSCKLANFLQILAAVFVSSQGWRVNVFLAPLQTYQAENVQSSSLKPSSCCLRQSQIVDLTLSGVREHMKSREKELDRWTIECTAVLWKTVWRIPKFTPHLWCERNLLKGYGFRAEARRPADHMWKVFLWMLVCMHPSVSTFTCLVQKWQIKVRWRFVPTCSH